MSRAHNPDDICATCDWYYTGEKAEKEYIDIGMGLCLKSVYTPTYGRKYVSWNSEPCVSHRLDRPNLAVRRQYVALQQSKETPP